MTNSLLRVAGALLLLPAFVSTAFASAQQQAAPKPLTHQYYLTDPALASAAQRYDWAQEGKGIAQSWKS